MCVYVCVLSVSTPGLVTVQYRPADAFLEMLVAAFSAWMTHTKPQDIATVVSGT